MITVSFKFESGDTIMTTALRALMASYLVLVFAAPASAYIGPGAGAGAIAIVFGVLGAVLMAIVAVVWYPIKRALRRSKTVQTED